MNQAAVYVVLERFHDVRKASDMALKLLDKKLEAQETKFLLDLKEKAMIRKAFAFYRLKRWREAEELYARCLRLFPQSQQAKSGLNKARSRQKESESGKYNIDRLAKSATSTEKRTALDIADFVGPVEMGYTEGCGRGLVATRDIAAGEILMVNKPIATSTEVVTGHSYSQLTWPDFLPKGCRYPASGIHETSPYDAEIEYIRRRPDVTRLKRELTYKCYHNPELAKWLQGFWAGDVYPVPPTNPDLNYPTVEIEEHIPVDFGRMCAVSVHNSFQLDGTDRDEPGDYAKSVGERPGSM
jgi:tetratricopeptide (TPR) repeat protein